ncbi:MAG: hypothetical protein AVDCRST_MAG89-4908, partial [uncultured Gemmatimonadetes bacterium]
WGACVRGGWPARFPASWEEVSPMIPLLTSGMRESPQRD